MKFNPEDYTVLHCPDGQFSVDVLANKKDLEIGKRLVLPFYFGSHQEIDEKEIDYDQTREVEIKLTKGDTLFSDFGPGLVVYASPLHPLS